MKTPKSNAGRRPYALAIACVSVFLVPTTTIAVSPTVIQQGRALFEKNWTARNPSLGGDGLGPLFNGQSCVGCHNQGGVGGAGDARFNAKTLGIESMQISGGPVSNETIVASIQKFYPGFVDRDGVVSNTFAVPHHGGGPLMDKARKHLAKSVSAEFSKEGGPTDASEVQLANATPILYSANDGQYTVSIRARIYQRNTTPLFGAGLIDQVSAKQLESIQKQQSRHPEISGRIATLSDGRVGRFGWRGNVSSLLDFCDQACAAEVGLETKRKKQPSDPTNQTYANTATDISDQQIRLMAAFVAALPAPQRDVPSDLEKQKQIAHGEKLFAAVGCAVCHTPTVGPAVGIYSDLLIHDMGSKLTDLNAAEPYLKVTPASSYSREVSGSRTRTIRQNDNVRMRNYYGSRSTITAGTTNTVREAIASNSNSVRPGYSGTRGKSRPSNVFYFEPSPTPSSVPRIIPVGSFRHVSSFEQTTEVVQKRRSTATTRISVESGKDFYTQNVRETTQLTTTISGTNYLRLQAEPTYVMQEWRTPPLWGVRDSAPYMHDGRAETLVDAIVMHDGEGAGTRDRFLNLSISDRRAIIAFLNTMVAPHHAPKPLAKL